MLSYENIYSSDKSFLELEGWRVANGELQLVAMEDDHNTKFCLHPRKFSSNQQVKGTYFCFLRHKRKKKKSSATKIVIKLTAWQRQIPVRFDEKESTHCDWWIKE